MKSTWYLSREMNVVGTNNKRCCCCTVVVGFTRASRICLPLLSVLVNTFSNKFIGKHPSMSPTSYTINYSNFYCHSDYNTHLNYWHILKWKWKDILHYIHGPRGYAMRHDNNTKGLFSVSSYTTVVVSGLVYGMSFFLLYLLVVD